MVSLCETGRNAYVTPTPRIWGGRIRPLANPRLSLGAESAFTSGVIFFPMKFPIIPALGSAIMAGISLVTPAFAAVNIDYVPIGNTGNAADVATGSIYGAVAYNYQISKNETTINQ